MADIGQKLTSVPFGEMIISLGMGISQAQVELDRASAAVARMMSGVDPADRVQFGGQSLSLIELGFTPTFYQFIESTIEVKMVVNMRSSSSSEVDVKTKSNTVSISSYNWWGGGASVRAVSQTVDAKYTSQYDYSVEGSSLVRTKLVPVPPPSILEERIRLLMEEEEAIRDKARLETELPGIRTKLVNEKAIENWNPPTNVRIFSVQDLQTYFLEDHAEFGAIIESLPDILIDSDIKEAFTDRYNEYRSDLSTRLDTAVSGWTPEQTGVYGSLSDIQAAFLEQHSDLADEISANRDLLEVVAIQNKLKTKFDAYKTGLTNSLNDLINAMPIAVGSGYDSVQDLGQRALQPAALLSSQLLQNPAILDAARAGTAKTRFDAYKSKIQTDVIAKSGVYTIDDSKVYANVTEVQRDFLSEHIALTDDLSTDTVLMQLLLNNLKGKYNTYRASISSTLNTDFDAYTVPEGSLPVSAQALLNEFLQSKPDLAAKLEVYPNFIDNSVFAGKVSRKFEDYKSGLTDTINGLLTAPAASAWFPPLDEGLRSEAGVRDYFFDTHPNLDIRKAGLADIQDDLNFSKQVNYVTIMEFLKNWEPTDAQKADNSKTLETHFFDTVTAQGMSHTGIKGKVEGLQPFKDRMGVLKISPAEE